MQNVVTFRLVSSDYCRLLQGTEDTPSYAGLIKQRSTTATVRDSNYISLGRV